MYNLYVDVVLIVVERLKNIDLEETECDINFSPEIENIAWVHPVTLPVSGINNSAEIGGQLAERAKETPIVVALDSMRVDEYLSEERTGIKLSESNNFYPVLRPLADTDSQVIAADFVSKQETFKNDAMFIALSAGIILTFDAAGRLVLTRVEKYTQESQERSDKDDKIRVTRRKFLKTLGYLAGAGVAFVGCSKVVTKVLESADEHVTECKGDMENATPITGPGSFDSVARNVVVHSKLKRIADITDRQGKLVMGAGHYVDRDLLATRYQIDRPDALLDSVLREELAFFDAVEILPSEVQVELLTDTIFNATTSRSFNISSEGEDVILDPVGYFYHDQVSFPVLNEMIKQRQDRKIVEPIREFSELLVKAHEEGRY